MRWMIVGVGLVALTTTSCGGSNHTTVSDEAITQLGTATHVRFPAEVVLRHDDADRLEELSELCSGIDGETTYLDMVSQ